jgi:hypothetical protein
MVPLRSSSRTNSAARPSEAMARCVACRSCAVRPRVPSGAGAKSPTLVAQTLWSRKPHPGSTARGKIFTDSLRSANAASLLRARPNDWRFRPSAFAPSHVGVVAGRCMISMRRPVHPFTHHVRENRNDHIVGEVWFDSIPFSKAASEICLAMASEARRARAAACPARIPHARRGEGVSGLCSFERRQPERHPATIDAAAVTGEGARCSSSHGPKA